MGLLGIGIREARDRAQTRAAKLEAKLGRKVTEHARYITENPPELRQNLANVSNHS